MEALQEPHGVNESFRSEYVPLPVYSQTSWANAHPSATNDIHAR
jgi:hypothetical protein